VLEHEKLITDLTDDCAALRDLLAGRPDSDWTRPSPAPGWSVADQIAHLSFVFKLAGTAVAAPQEFAEITSRASGDFDAAVNAALKAYPTGDPEALVRAWSAQNADTIGALADVEGDTVVPWLVRPLPARVLACAGLMELFAHGQDVRDGLGVHEPRTDRVGPVAWFVTQTRDFGYQFRGEEPPVEEFRYELTAPSGAEWVFGSDDTTQIVRGPAEDLCLLATRRRHRDDLALTAEGAAADHWLNLAQAYRGNPGPGRQPGQFQALAR
jgi:enediyne biosynthesis protein E11